MENILIGTSGYDHVELKGSFYPMDLRRKDFLTYYSTKFNALELNTTFYGMPTVEKINSFLERTEDRIHYSIKVNRLLTHDITRNWKNDAQDFKTALSPMLKKNLLSSVLFQFPESFHYTNDNRFYLSDLLNEFFDFPTVVEFRHRSWIKESVFEGLEKRNSGIVFCDMPQLKNLPNGFSCGTPFIGKNAYIRMHGRNENGWYVNSLNQQETTRYDYEYSIDELKSFIPVIEQSLKEGRTVQMYFNNHPKGTGTKNALEMQELIRSHGAYQF